MRSSRFFPTALASHVPSVVNESNRDPKALRKTPLTPSDGGEGLGSVGELLDFCQGLQPRLLDFNFGFTHEMRESESATSHSK